MTATSTGEVGSRATPEIRWRPDRLDALMSAHSMSNADLGDRINADRVAVYRYRKGLRVPSAVVVTAIARVFNTTVEFLMGAQR